MTPVLKSRTITMAARIGSAAARDAIAAPALRARAAFRRRRAQAEKGGAAHA